MTNQEGIRHSIWSHMANNKYYYYTYMAIQTLIYQQQAQRSSEDLRAPLSFIRNLRLAGFFDMLCQMKKLTFMIMMLVAFDSRAVSPCCTVDPGQTYCLLLDKSDFEPVGSSSKFRKYKLRVCGNNGPLESYEAVLGIGGDGNKQKQGDGKVPEGTYKIIEQSNTDRETHKKPHKYYKYMLLDYPDASGSAGIEIHGTDSAHVNSINLGDNWTDGCINVSNDDTDKLFRFVGIGTKIEIRPASASSK